LDEEAQPIRKYKHLFFQAACTAHKPLLKLPRCVFIFVMATESFSN